MELPGPEAPSNGPQTAACIPTLPGGAADGRRTKIASECCETRACLPDEVVAVELYSTRTLWVPRIHASLVGARLRLGGLRVVAGA
jgi:hypothetical protein